MRFPAARLPALVTAAVLAVVVSGCAQPDFRYLANPDRDVVLRVPRAWSPVDANAVLGLNPDGSKPTDTGWVVFYDGAAQPSVNHVKADSAIAPVLQAESVDISADQRSTIDADFLRDLIKPVTTTARDADEMSRAASGLPPRDFTMIASEVVNTKSAQGVHVVFSYTTGSTTEYYDKLAVTDPRKTRIHYVLIHCNEACFTAHETEIDDAVDSLTVKLT